MLWRVSIAGVAVDGPFSAFQGYDRHLMVLTGDGMVLEGLAAERVRMDRPQVPVAFSGDTPVTARLIAGPVSDFNLFALRDVFRSSLDVVDTADRFARLPGAELLVHILDGHGVSAAGSLVPGDSLLAGPDEAIEITAAGGEHLRLAVAGVWRAAQ